MLKAMTTMMIIMVIDDENDDYFADKDVDDISARATPVADGRQHRLPFICSKLGGNSNNSRIIQPAPGISRR